MKNDTIISSPYFFTDKERIENAIITIDEFDAAVKADMLDSILEKSDWRRIMKIKQVDMNLLKQRSKNFY